MLLAKLRIDLMSRREFLNNALAVHDEYEQATTVLRKMMKENVIYGPDWDAANARQRAALEQWSSLLRQYSGIHVDQPQD
jgi:hypothetical protein